MASYNFDYKAMQTLEAELVAMDTDLKNEIKDVAKEIGKQLKSNTESAMPREDGSPKWGIHAADEVKMSVSNGAKKTTITVKGGKKTGKLWWLIDNGHVAKNGKFVPGAHFTDKAYNATDVSTPVEKLMNKVVKK